MGFPELGCVGTALLGLGGGGVFDPLQTPPFPTRGLPCVFDRCWSNGTSVRVEKPPEKTVLLASRLSRSPKVIGTDTDRSDTDDFLLTFCSNHGPILYRFQDIARYIRAGNYCFPDPVPI